jgi:hypothetical protein
MREHEDVFSISMPLLEEYEPVIRLTVSGIAAQMGYTYDDVEDIKNSISEIYNQGLLQVKEEGWTFKANFHVKINGLKADIELKCANNLERYENEMNQEFSLQTSRSLMDSVLVLKQNDSIKVVIEKLLYSIKGEHSEQESSAI